MFPNYTIPDEWEADTITGAVPSQLFSVLYDLKEIIELIGQWKDLSREATSLVDAINQSVVANPDITAGTKTKITYDEKGLVTAGEDVTWSDVTNKP
jgi:ABC-type Fe3+-hydroxamate transport system substrate-binding protein